MRERERERERERKRDRETDRERQMGGGEEFILKVFAQKQDINAIQKHRHRTNFMY